MRRADTTAVGPGVRSAGTRWAVVVAVAAALTASASAAGAGVTIALQPATQSVAPGAEFDLFIAVTEGGSAFNAFDAIVGFSPSALTVVQLSPLSLQEGSLMTTACGNRFHRFRQGADRDTITDVLLCNGVSVPGPGQIYRLRFQASMTPQTTTVQFLPGIAFYNAGLAVTPVATSDATIIIAAPVGVETPLPTPGVLRLHASPNPCRSLMKLRIETDTAGLQELTVCDLLGRVVRRLGSGWFDAGRREGHWDGRDDSGARVAPGIYYAQLRTPAGAVRSPIVRLE
jgi:flagellar hook capping protein FlgD